jgi:hypothetical protein
MIYNRWYWSDLSTRADLVTCNCTWLQTHEDWTQKSVRMKRFIGDLFWEIKSTNFAQTRCYEGRTHRRIYSFTSVCQILNFLVHFNKVDRWLALQGISLKPAGQLWSKDASFWQQIQEIHLLFASFWLAEHLVCLGRVIIFGEIKDKRF